MSEIVELDTDIRSAMLFRILFGTQDDRYEPENAAPLLCGLTGLDNEALQITVKLWVMEVQCGLTVTGTVN